MLFLRELTSILLSSARWHICHGGALRLAHDGNHLGVNLVGVNFCVLGGAASVTDVVVHCLDVAGLMAGDEQKEHDPKHMDGCNQEATRQTTRFQARD